MAARHGSSAAVHKYLDRIITIPKIAGHGPHQQRLT
jgi:hypothetical protein